MRRPLSGDWSRPLGGRPERNGTVNAVCLADFGDGGVAFVAEPEMPPRNVNWSSKGHWVHYAKIAAVEYRELFGESPSHTLGKRRPRGRPHWD